MNVLQSYIVKNPLYQSAYHCTSRRSHAIPAHQLQNTLTKSVQELKTRHVMIPSIVFPVLDYRTTMYSAVQSMSLARVECSTFHDQ